MQTKFLIIPGALLAWAVSASAGNLTIDEHEIDFGEKYQFAEVTHDIRVWNHSSETIKFEDVKPSRMGATLSFDQRTLAPYASQMAHLKFPLLDNKGHVSTRLEFDTEEGGKKEQYSLSVGGYVDTVLDEIEPGLDFGVVDLEAEARAQKSLKLTSASESGLRITRILEAPDFIEARVGSDGNELLMTPKKINVLGYNKGVVKVAINSPRQPQAWVSVLMDAHGNVVPDQNPLSLGVQRPSSLHQTRLQLNSRNGKPFHVGKISPDESARVTVEETPCLPHPRDDCRAYFVTPRKDRPQGQVVGKIGFELTDTSQVLNVTLAGIFFADSTKIQSLNAPDAKSGESQTTAPRKTDLSKSIARAIDDKPSGDLPGTGPLLRWQVANEAGIYGYAIYRGDSENGHFERINEKIVRADNEGDNTTANYQWRDVGAEKGKEYWYFVSIFYNSGKKLQLTAPQKVVAK